MEIVRPKYDVGVIVARFQVPDLHESHLELLREVTSRHLKVIVILGVTQTLSTPESPLDFEMRKQMVLSHFPGVIVGFIQDHLSDVVWSKNLDRTIGALTTPMQSVVLYGGRESFIPHYQGRYKTLEFEQQGFFSGTEIRKRASIEVRNSADFRAGVIWGVMNQFPRTIPTVDIVIFRTVAGEREMLLGKKEGENLLRFIGGFAEPHSENFESDARREAQEETGVEVSDPVYLGSVQVNDPRYRGKDRIKTLIFTAEYVFGEHKAADDIAHVEWKSVKTLKEDDIEPLHRPIFRILKTKGKV